MDEFIQQLFSEGESFLKEAKAEFLVNEDDQCDAMCKSCNSIKRFLDAYELHLFKEKKPTQNYHLLLHTISQKDPDFDRFTKMIYEVKCFSEESKNNPEGFFLYDDEINDILKIVLEIRNYIAEKLAIKESILDNISASFMTT